MSAIDSILKVVRGIVRLRGGTDNTLIGNTQDKLKVESYPSVDENINVSELLDMQTDILRQLKIMTTHLQYLTDLDLDDGDEEDS